MKASEYGGLPKINPTKTLFFRKKLSVEGTCFISFRCKGMRLGPRCDLQGLTDSVMC